jgi:hypothetical protein
MAEPKKKRRKPQQTTYRWHKNAISVTVYDPQGQNIPSAVRKEIEDSVFNVALANKLLISIAIT